MGWVWIDDNEGDVGSIGSGSGGREACSTRKVVRSQCRTEEVEPGKFFRKCEKTEEVLRDCLGKPTEVLQSNKEYTEDDVTDMVRKGSFKFGKFEDGAGPFDFPGLRSDIEGIEHHFLGSINRFFETAQEMRNNFFSVFGDFSDENSSASRSTRRGIPIDSYPQMEAPCEKSKKNDSGDDDLSGLARDV